MRLLAEVERGVDEALGLGEPAFEERLARIGYGYEPLLGRLLQLGPTPTASSWSICSSISANGGTVRFTA